jgi:hypothetical protein
MSWRDNCRPIIARVLTENAGKTETEIRGALYDAYPYGQRKYHPYRIWLDEIKRQRNLKRPLGERHYTADPRQGKIFEEVTSS